MLLQQPSDADPTLAAIRASRGQAPDLLDRVRAGLDGRLDGPPSYDTTQADVHRLPNTS
jgi:hypothetical protein